MRYALLFAFSIFGSCNVAQAWNTDDDRTRGEIQGLYEIRKEAMKFMDQWNKSYGTSYELLEPNSKTFVPRCAVPLRTAWSEENKGQRLADVSVICDKTNFPGMKRWVVVVPALEWDRTATAKP